MTIQPIGSASVALYITPADLEARGLTPSELTLEEALELTRSAFRQAGLALEGTVEIEAYPERRGVLVFAHVRAPERTWFSFLRLADLAALGEAADSLAGVPLPTEHIADFFLPPLDTREKMFYDLADATPVRPARYANVRQIPQVQIFPRGTIYRILLGAYSQPPAVSVFRSVAPLSQETKADRRTYYYAGGYASYEEAQAAAARLKKLGFRNPRIVAWQDGTYDAEPGATTTPKPGTPGKNQPEYRVEIRNASAEGLSRMVRDVIATRATGKEISRISDSATGEPVFVVGTFSNRTLAETVVGAIQEADPSLDVSLVTIP